MKETIRRIDTLDYMRVGMMIMIFLFHSSMHANSDFGLFSYFIDSGAIAMEGFFMLSGFVLAFRWNVELANDRKYISDFYLKRLLSICPLYFLTMIIKKIVCQKIFDINSLLIFPFELLGITSFFDGTFADGAGDWFVSCLLFCYFLFPYLYWLLDKNKGLKIFCVLYIISSLAPVVASLRDYSWTYPNPFFRMLQFSIGIILACTYKEYLDNTVLKTKIKKYIIVLGIIIICLAFGLFISFLKYKGWGSYASYEFITIPFWGVIIILLTILSMYNCKINGVIAYLSKISYPFYLAQAFCFLLGSKIYNLFWAKEYGSYENQLLFACCLFSCFCWAIVMDKLDCMIKKFVKEKIS